MEEKSDIERLFNTLDESAQIIKEKLNMTYLDALAESGENLFQRNIVQEIDEKTKEKLRMLMQQINIDEYPKETIRKAFQLAVLKGMKEASQPHHALTPDAVCLFISYLVDKLVRKKSFVLLDPAIGTANLVTAIQNQIGRQVKCYGFEVDESLIRLSYVNANLQRNELELFHEDSLKPFKLPPVDVVVSDLPFGYYPNKEVAKNYELNEEKPLVHHLMIEQSLKRTTEGGILIFLVPNFLFAAPSAQKLHQLIKKQAIILGLMQLPLSMFKAKQMAKSIFILQKKGKNVKPPRQALLVELPSFSRKEALAEIVQRIEKWMKEELYIDGQTS